MEVDIHPLAPLAAANAHAGDEDQLILLHATPLATVLGPSLKANTYVYNANRIEQLEPVLWSLEDFMKNNASKWFNYRTDRGYSNTTRIVKDCDTSGQNIVQCRDGMVKLQ